jgi:hypothetical protein
MSTPAELEQRIRDQRSIRIENKDLDVEWTRWIVEGDVALREDQIAGYVAERVALAERIASGAPVQKEGLLAIEAGGKILRWSHGKTLDYCVWRPSFASDDEHASVVHAMALACDDWESICGVKFRHRADKDESPPLDDVLFPVVHGGAHNLLALAFFPDQRKASERIVWVFDDLFRSPVYRPANVLRHELGHVLGFRHEHIRPEAPGFFHPEDLQHTAPLTPYDSKSVMHYVGFGVGDPNLAFTDLDKTGARQVYGGPYREYHLEP